MPVTPLTMEGPVRLVIDTSLDTTAISQFIQDASTWVTEELVPIGLSDDRLELVTRYLTCALIRMKDLGLVAQTVQDTREQYQVDPKVTEYLTRAASFDPTGTIIRVFLKQAPKANFKVGRTFAHPRHRRFRT